MPTFFSPAENRGGRVLAPGYTTGGVSYERGEVFLFREVPLYTTLHGRAWQGPSDPNVHLFEPEP